MVKLFTLRPGGPFTSTSPKRQSQHNKAATDLGTAQLHHFYQPPRRPQRRSSIEHWSQSCLAHVTDDKSQSEPTTTFTMPKEKTTKRATKARTEKKKKGTSLTTCQCAAATMLTLF
jgi:hypothetical protein